MAVAVLLSLDEFDTAVRLYTEWLDSPAGQGSAFAFAHASSFRAFALLRRGDLSEAEADARAALEAASTLVFTYAHLAEVLAERGQFAEAIETLDRPACRMSNTAGLDAGRLLAPRALLRIASGDVTRGIADLLAAGESIESFGIHNPSYSAWRSEAALATLGLGDRGEARRLVREEIELARRWGTPRPLGVSLRVAGLVEGGDEGLELLRESVDVLAALAGAARAGQVVHGARRSSTSRQPARRSPVISLQDGLEHALRCGAIVLAERAHAELLATGARPRRLVRSGIDSLTPSERRVAKMATEGQTNREIAQALFVTPKTVETHLSHVYRKLGIDARSQLPRALSESLS